MSDLRGQISGGQGLQGTLNTTESIMSALLSAGIKRGGYVWFKWSNTDPTQDSDMLDTPAPFIGICSTDTTPAPTDYTMYYWYEYKGESGMLLYNMWVDLGNGGSIEDFLSLISKEEIQFTDDAGDFPTVGDPTRIYIDKLNNKIYRWDDTTTTYKVVGSDYNDIKIIYGGDADAY